MKRIACLVIELDEHETVEDVIANLKSSNSKILNIPAETDCRLNIEKTSNDDDWRVKLKKILNDLGENISTIGYGSMFDIMECVEQNPEYKKYFVVKELYAYVTQKTGRSYSRIERNIRAMVERIYSKNPIDKLCEILGVSAVSCGKVSNVDFIAIIIDKIF